MVRRRDLAATLFRVGLTAYGGPAIVAQIRQAIVFEKECLSDEEFQESVAFAQMLPGPVAIQTAAHVGWRLHGAHGAFLALAAYSLPAFALILALSTAYFHFGSLPAVAAVFKALATVIVAIVVESILSMPQPPLKDLRGVAIAALAAWGFFAGANAPDRLRAHGRLGGTAIVPSASGKPSCWQGPPPSRDFGGPSRANGMRATSST